MNVNPGVIILNNVPPAPDATIIVTGVGRSGTSMAAGVLHGLGLPLGSKWEEGLYEDQPLRTALFHFYHDMRAKLIGMYNHEFPRWGFKFPSLHRHMLPLELGQFRNARLVVMYRDATATAIRARMQPWDILAEQVALGLFVKTCVCPVLLGSYERAIAEPENFAAVLAAFSGLKHRAGAAAVVGDKRAYLEAPHESS